MKNKNNIWKLWIFILSIFVLQGCQDLEQPPLGDYLTDGPIINLNYPSPGGSTVIQSADEFASITINFEVTDDIEITNISVDVDGVEISNVSSFSDVKSVVVDNLVFDQVTTGEHTLTVSATDSHENVTTQTVTFTKVETPPYDPVFEGETFYMPFEGNYNDFISTGAATEIGSPAFTEDAFVGETAFTTTADSYIEFPISQLSEALGSEFSGAFWYKASGSPDRAGIITIGVPGAGESRMQGLRLFREGNETEQRIKLNIGTGAAESWNDGGIVDVGEWVHVAFTISPTSTHIYLNGMLVNSGAPTAAIDWTGAEKISIGSGAPTFSYWGHNSDANSALDELRFFNKALTESEISLMSVQSSQIFNMSFNDNFSETYSGESATTVGNPGFAGQAFKGSNAYQGATDSYLTFPLSTIGLGQEFTAAFRFKVNGTPDRAGILTVGPPGNTEPASLNKGFKFFRENASGMQRFKLNVGVGDANVWVDGGNAADVDPAVDEWVQFAFTISSTEARVYINGEMVKESPISGISWDNTTTLTIMSGAPFFTHWNHNSDLSIMDELKFFDKALTQEEIQGLL